MPDDNAPNALSEKIRCDACPVMCYIADGNAGACDRYANHGGELVRLDPLTVIAGAARRPWPFLDQGENAQDWDGDVVQGNRTFVTAVGAGTTYPDYKPAPFIVSQQVDGVDMVTVVTEGIFSYCGVKVKIDTDRHIGHERAIVRVEGEAIGHVMTAEYGSQDAVAGRRRSPHRRLQERRPRDLRRAACACATAKRWRCRSTSGVTIVVQAGHAPIINGTPEKLMRVGCGSATIGMFAKQWQDHVDEVVVVDDHITGVLTEHQAGKVLDMRRSGIKVKGRRSTPGRYFQVAEPGTGWGGTNVDDPLTILETCRSEAGLAGPAPADGLHHRRAMGLLRAGRQPCPATGRRSRRRCWPSAERIAENCEPSLCSVLFMGGAGGSLARRRHRKSGAPDPLGQGCADLCLLRRGRGLCLARRRHHRHGRCAWTCPPIPSATCRRPRWWPPSNSPCGWPITRPLAAMWITSSRSRMC